MVTMSCPRSELGVLGYPTTAPDSLSRNVSHHESPVSCTSGLFVVVVPETRGPYVPTSPPVVIW